MSVKDLILAGAFGGKKGSGGVTSWNDLPDKPFDIVELMPETQFAYNEGFGAFVAQTDFELVAGRTYIINWNGVEYISTARAERLKLNGIDMNVISAGNPVIAGGVNNGLPFAVLRILIDPSAKGLIGAAPLDGSTAITVGIKGYTFDDVSDTLVLDIRYSNTGAVLYATPAELLAAFWDGRRIVFPFYGSTSNGIPTSYQLHTVSEISAEGFKFATYVVMGVETKGVTPVLWNYNHDGTYSIEV